MNVPLDPITRPRRSLAFRGLCMVLLGAALGCGVLWFLSVVP